MTASSCFSTPRSTRARLPLMTIAWKWSNYEWKFGNSWYSFLFSWQLVLISFFHTKYLFRAKLPFVTIAWTRSNFELKFGNKELHFYSFQIFFYKRYVWQSQKKTEVTFKMKIMIIMFGSRKVSPKSPEIDDQKPSTKKPTNPLPESPLSCPPTPASRPPQASWPPSRWPPPTCQHLLARGLRRHQGECQELPELFRPLWQGLPGHSGQLGQVPPNLHQQAKIEPSPPGFIRWQKNLYDQAGSMHSSPLDVPLWAVLQPWPRHPSAIPSPGVRHVYHLTSWYLLHPLLLLRLCLASHRLGLPPPSVVVRWLRGRGGHRENLAHFQVDRRLNDLSCWVWEIVCREIFPVTTCGSLSWTAGHRGHEPKWNWTLPRMLDKRLCMQKKWATHKHKQFDIRNGLLWFVDSWGCTHN